MDAEIECAPYVAWLGHMGRTNLELEVVNQKNFTAQFYYLKVETPIVRNLFHVSILKMEGMGQVAIAYFGVVGKPVPLFYI